MILISGFMMMVATRRKVRIISEAIYGKRYVSKILVRFMLQYLNT